MRFPDLYLGSSYCDPSPVITSCNQDLHIQVKNSPILKTNQYVICKVRLNLPVNLGTTKDDWEFINKPISLSNPVKLRIAQGYVARNFDCSLKRRDPICKESLQSS